MRAEAEAERAPIFRDPRLHVLDQFGNPLSLVRPHQVDIATLRGSVACIRRKTSKVQRRHASGAGSDARRIKLQLPELTV
jgi:hypothetical protein